MLEIDEYLTAAEALFLRLGGGASSILVGYTTAILSHPSCYKYRLVEAVFTVEYCISLALWPLVHSGLKTHTHTARSCYGVSEGGWGTIGNKKWALLIINRMLYNCLL